MIYDCFIFFNELELLEIRLNELNEVVDKFVLVESTKTFTNKDKPLYFNDNKAKFSKFLDKIIHVIVDDFPEYDNAWTFEKHQRNCIDRGLVNCKHEDVIIISDLDEIPNPSKIKTLAKTLKGIYSLELKDFYYFLNNLNIKRSYWLGTRILKYSDYLNYTPSTNQRDQREKIKNAGWHFSYLGGIDKILYKIDSFSHQEFNNQNYTNPEQLKEIIASGKDLFGRKYKYKALKIDKTFPRYVQVNQDKLNELVLPFLESKIVKLIKSFIKRYE